MGHPHSLGGDDPDGVWTPEGTLLVVVEGGYLLHLEGGGAAGERDSGPGSVIPVGVAAQHQIGC